MYLDNFHPLSMAISPEHKKTTNPIIKQIRDLTCVPVMVIIGKINAFTVCKRGVGDLFFISIYVHRKTTNKLRFHRK